MDRLTSMKVFVKVASARSFSGAAQQLGISQGTASKHVQMLEDWLGVRVLHRTTRSVALTAAGEKFFPQISRVLEDIEAAADAARPTATVRGSMRITAPVAFGSTRLGPLVADFLRRHPEVSMSVNLFDRSAALVEEGYDVAIRTRPAAGAGLVSYRLMPLNYVVCAAPCYLARHAPPVTPADLAHHLCIANSNDSAENWRFTGPAGEVLVQVRGRLRVNNALMRRDAARAGAGVLLSVDYLVGDDFAAGRLVQVLRDYLPSGGTLYAVCSSDRATTPKIRSLIDYLTARLRD